MRDEELIKRIGQGEKYLFAELADRYYDEIFRFCYYKTGNEQTAYDCTQETFFHLLKFMDSYIEQKKFKGYLLRIALNVCRDYYRKNPFESSLEELREKGEGISRKPEEYSGPAGALPEQERRQDVEEAMVVRQCLMLLPEYQREVIILRFYYGYKVREIADITGVGLSAAKSRLKQGMDKLRLQLEKEGIYENR